MHRHVREHLEEMLADKGPTAGDPLSPQTHSAAGPEGHLAKCRECREEVKAMREQAALLREWRVPDTVEVEPRPGFYARVLERIEAEGPGSIWSLFFDSAFGYRIALASLALAALLCVCLVSSERFFGSDSGVAEFSRPELRGQVIMGEDQAGLVLTGAVDSVPDQDSVLVNLVTYREQ